MVQEMEGTLLPLLTRARNPTSPAVLPQRPSSPPRGGSEPESRLVPFLQSPPVGSGILALSFFFLIVFFSNVLLAQVTLTTLGIAVTMGTFGILVTVILL